MPQHAGGGAVMVCKLLFVGWTLLISVTTVFAVDPPHLLLSTPLTDIGKTQAIDMLQSPEGDIIGFVGADSTNRKMTIWDVDGNVTRLIALDVHPVSIVHRFSPNRDTLSIYAICVSRLDVDPWGYTGLMLVTVTSDTVISRVRWFVYYNSGMCDPGHLMLSNLALRTDPGNVAVISFGFSYLVECYELTLGPSWYTLAKTIDYSLDLDSIICQRSTSANSVADFYGDTGSEFWGYLRDVWGYDYRDYYEDPNWADVKGTYLTVIDSANESLLWTWKSGAMPVGLFAGQFDSSDEKYEVIYQGYGSDWLGLHPGVNHFAACYSYATGTLVEKWFTSLTSEQFMALDTAEMSLVGMKNCSTVVTLRCRDGRLGEPWHLGHCLRKVRFVEQSAPVSQLLLAGLEGDTIRVIGFDNVVDVPENNRPLDFRAFLAQNRPNPFNSETHIEFSVPRVSVVRVEVFNLLGQRVRTLLDEEIRAGKHSVTWDGTNDEGVAVSSGVYLYRLRAEEFVQSKKMVLLK
jgi:hypothetical protein